MESLSDVTIVSAFGRGQWLAQELQSKGHSVQFVDTSESMGPWGADDWEGPFGYFDTVALTPSQRERLVQEEEVLSVEKGFCLWLKNGPLEFKSSLTDYLLRSHNISPEIEDYLRSDSKEEQGLHWDSLRNKPFRDSWLVHFAHQAFSTVYRSNHDSMGWAPPLPIFSPYYFRRATRVGRAKGLQALMDKGVKVLNPAKVVDILIQDRNVTALEVEGEPSRVVKSKALIWMITSEETKWFSPTLKDKLYPKGGLKPTWYWTRYRFELPSLGGTLGLPSHFAMIQDNLLSWSHDNFLLAVKTANANQYDIWLRLPLHYRFQAQQHINFCTKIGEVLNARLPGPKPTCVEMPQERHYSEDQLGAPLFPVYDLMSLERFRPVRLKNIFFGGPEHWPRHDWGAQLAQQEELANSVDAHLTSLTKGAQERDRQIHA